MISVVQPYYNHKALFDWQMQNLWRTWTARMKREIELIIVDDGSPDAPCTPPANSHGVNLKILRVDEDIQWNTGGAANLGIQEAAGDWILHADFDIGIAAKSVGILDLDMSDPDTMYWPWRSYTTSKGFYKDIRPHCNTFLMNKDKFWEIGGFDEDFAGQWGWCDTEFHAIRCKKAGIINKQVKMPALEHIRNRKEYGTGASGNINRKDPYRANRKHVRVTHSNWRLYKERQRDTDECHTPTDHVRFNWHQVYP